MLDPEMISHYTKALTDVKLHYDRGYVRCVRPRGTVDQWMFHVTEIRKVRVQRSRAGMLRVRVYLVGSDEFNTPVLEYEDKDKLILACKALLSLRDLELDIEPQIYCESAYSVQNIDYF